MIAFLGRVALILGIIPLVIATVVIGLSLIVIMTVAMVPLLICQHWRSVRWLALSGCVYYPALAGGLMFGLGLYWWLVLPLLLPTFVFISFLPDPYTYFTRPLLRNAVLRAIEHVERSPDQPLDYHTVQVVGSEASLIFILLRAPDERGSSTVRYLAVGKDGAVEELSTEEQRRRFGFNPNEGPFLEV